MECDRGCGAPYARDAWFGGASETLPLLKRCYYQPTIVLSHAFPPALSLRRVAHVVVDEVAHLRARHHHGAHLLAHVGRNRIVGHERDRVARLGGEFLVVVEALD